MLDQLVTMLGDPTIVASMLREVLKRSKLLDGRNKPPVIRKQNTKATAKS